MCLSMAVTLGVGAVGALILAIALWLPIIYVATFMGFVSVGCALPVAITLLRKPIL